VQTIDEYNHHLIPDDKYKAQEAIVCIGKGEEQLL
jgi:hypothetical protein